MKRKLRILMILAYIFFIYFLCLISPALAFDRTKSIIAVQDSTIDAYNSNSNYGGDESLEVGHFVDWLKSFIKFDLSEAPENFHTAELRLEFSYIEATSVLSVYETSSQWSEYSITWNNAPAEGGIVISSQIAEEVIYVIDITDDIEGETGYYSLCLTSSNTHWLIIASRQCYSWYDPPTIVFTYTVSDLPFIIGGVVAVVVIGTIIIVIVYSKANKKKKQKGIPLQGSQDIHPYRIQEKQSTQVQDIPTIKEEVKYCIKCGSQNQKESIFCVDCGYEFPE